MGCGFVGRFFLYVFIQVLYQLGRLVLAVLLYELFQLVVGQLDVLVLAVFPLGYFRCLFLFAASLFGRFSRRIGRGICRRIFCIFIFFGYIYIFYIMSII